MNSLRLTSRRFTTADQVAFATFSGDWNPMHLDPMAARRTPAGAVIVHGVHGVLWAMDRIAAGLLADSRLSAVDARFHRFVHLDRDVSVHIVRHDVGTLHAQLVVDGVLATSLSLTFDCPAAQQRLSKEDVPRSYSELPDTPLGRVPLTPRVPEMDGLAGWLTPPSGDASAIRLFPALCGALDESQVTALAQLSTVVGMACPGLHSIFNRFSASFIDGAHSRPGIGWRARIPDHRYPRTALTIRGSGLLAEAEALVRPAPVDAPALASVASIVRTEEFSDRKALIIGGSRGLGAVTAKLLAAGGAEVVVTYATGESDATALVDEIRAARGETAALCIRCDVLEDLESQLDGCLQHTTHLYYFATPHIARQNMGVFSATAFTEFTKFYVERFHDLCLLTLSAVAGGDLNVFLPSTVYASERPKGMTEYAMSKAAAEILCADLARAFPRLSIIAPRLPRVLTDQTATSLPLNTADAVTVMLPLLRAERQRTTPMV